MISIILPVRNEKFLQRTIEEILEKAKGDIEIIAACDGYWPDPPLKEDKKLKIIHIGQVKGMRNGINAGVAIAQGKYIMKLDGHCMLDEGFDIKLAEDCEDNWVVIPRRKRLDAENWCIQDVKKPDVDYEYLSYPDNPGDFGGPGLNGRIWTQKILKRKDNPKYDIDCNLSFQGSAWFTTKKYFYELELMDDEHWGPFWNEAQEISFKAWLSGGKVMINKKTFYAHLHKGKKHGRGYNLDGKWAIKGATYTKRWLVEDKMWHKQIHPLSWLIEKFMPMPTWPLNWKEDLKKLSIKKEI